MSTSFDLDLRNILPKLRAYALSLTRNGDRADDLVQQTALKALAGRNSFRSGTNFAGWIFRIQRNEFISERRRTHPTVDLDSVDAHMLSEPPRQEGGLALREFIGAFRHLSRGTRHALLLSQIEGHSYRQIASHAGVSIGTVKSRISRGRVTLAQLIDSPGRAAVAHSHHD